MKLHRLGSWLLAGLMLGTGLWASEELPEKTASPAENIQRPAFRGRPSGRVEAFRHCMARLRKSKPGEYERLQELKESDPKAFLMELRKVVSHREWHNARLAELDVACFKLSRQYRQARTEEEREVIKAELTKKVEESTDAMIEDFKERLAKMEKQLKTMESNRQQLVERRMKGLLQQGRKNHGKEGRRGEGRGKRASQEKADSDK